VINVPGKQILSNVQEFHKREGEVGYSTNGYMVIKDLLQKRIVIDKVMLFSDCQLWNNQGTDETIDSLWKQYKKLAPNAKLYLFDLAGLGKSPLEIQKNDVYLIAGWSDRIFDVLEALEHNSTALDLISQINK